MPKKTAARIELVWVAMEAINPEYQVPVAVYQDKEDAILDGWSEDDLEEVLFWRATNG